MKEFTPALTGILLAIVGLAVIAVILSPSANTSNVVNAGGSGFINAIKCAVAPVTGGTCAGSSLIPFTNSTITYGGLA